MLVKDEVECTIDLKSHQTKMTIMSSTATVDDISKAFADHCDLLLKKMSEFQERDSGWTLVEVAHLDINTNKYEAIKGNQYISLPPEILQKHACVNIKNLDEYCFKWAIISALSPVSTHSD